MPLQQTGTVRQKNMNSTQKLILKTKHKGFLAKKKTNAKAFAIEITLRINWSL